MADLTCPAQVPGIGRVDRIMLLDRRLEIAPHAPAHWCVPELPGERLTLRRDGDQLAVETFGNIAWWDDTAQPETSPTRSLHVESDQSAAEHLTAMWLGAAMPACVFDIKPLPNLSARSRT